MGEAVGLSQSLPGAGEEAAEGRKGVGPVMEPGAGTLCVCCFWDVPQCFGLNPTMFEGFRQSVSHTAC